MLHQVKSSDIHVVRFAGDSGDGIQLQGQEFTEAVGATGHDLGTLPDFPAEIRAPAGTTSGVSAFQIQFGGNRVHTPGDSPDVLVAFNPAALKVSAPLLQPGALIIVDEANFTERRLRKSGYTSNPLQDGSLKDFDIYPIDITRFTLETLDMFDFSRKEALRCRNFWVLGLMLWMFGLPRSPLTEWIKDKFGAKPQVCQANLAVVNAGHAFGETAERAHVLQHKIVIEAPLTPGEYRTIRGAEATALGLSAVSLLADLDLLFCSYPITPASGILHQLAAMENPRIPTFQAEDEIASCCAAIGASYGGMLGVTSSSGPGIALKTEAIGLAIASELPLLVINAQRAGPSTGLPTKTEQSDLLQAVHGRNADTPLPVIAANSPGDCFRATIDAARIALRHMTPVFLLLDSYLVNASELWAIPDIEKAASIETQLATAEKLPDNAPHEVLFARDPETCARPWAVPGKHKLMHRTAGLETDIASGHISYDPENHQAMTELRHAKIGRISRFLPHERLVQGTAQARLLVLGWGSSYGPIYEAVRRANKSGERVAQAHLRYLYPFPSNLEKILKQFDLILVPEMNAGQLCALIRSQLPGLAPRIRQYNRITGLPFQIGELSAAITETLKDG